MDQNTFNETEDREEQPDKAYRKPKHKKKRKMQTKNVNYTPLTIHHSPRSRGKMLFIQETVNWSQICRDGPIFSFLREKNDH